MSLQKQQTFDISVLYSAVIQRTVIPAGLHDTKKRKLLLRLRRRSAALQSLYGRQPSGVQPGPEDVSLPRGQRGQTPEARRDAPVLVEPDPGPQHQQHGERVRVEEAGDEEQRREQADGAGGVADDLVRVVVLDARSGGARPRAARVERRDDPGQARVARDERQGADGAQHGQHSGHVAGALGAAGVQGAQHLGDGELNVAGDVAAQGSC